MKYRKIISIVAAVLLIVAGTIIPATTVQAAVGTMNLSTSRGPVGSNVSVFGTGFTPNVTYYVVFGTTSVISGQTDAVAGSFSTTFIVPKVPRTAGAYEVKVTTTADTSNSIFFTVDPMIGIGKTTASVGESITIYGNGFLASIDAVSIYFDNVSVGTTRSDANGSFDGASFVVPETYQGIHAVRCTDSDTLHFSQSINLTVISKISANPASGGAGDKIELKGTGFAANSAISLYWDETVVTGASANSDLNGSFNVPSFSIPTGPKGSHAIKAQDANTNAASAAFTIAQKISISPTSGVAGTPVTVKGSGFDAAKPITIKYNAVTITPSSGAVTTDGSGGFSATFVVSAGATGNYTVEASDGTSLATATFQAISKVEINIVTTKDKPGYVGEEFTLSGDGLKPNTTVNIYFASDSSLLATATTDGNGHFSKTIKIPSSTPGNHTITVTDGLTIKNFDFFMEDKAPALPKLLLPTPDGKQEDKGQFTWEAVTDPSGVTYTFQIALDKEFTKVFLDKKLLQQPSYTPTEAEKLPSNKSSEPYYWRVKATDGTGLESAWTAPQAFNVGFVFEFAAWMFWVMGIIGGFLLFLFGFWLGRKTAY